MKDEPQLSAEIKDKLLTEREFYENTMGCFYQDELRAHDRAMRKRLATALEEQRATFVDEVKNRKATIKWLWGKQRTDDECFLMVMEQVQKIADILNGKE